MEFIITCNNGDFSKAKSMIDQVILQDSNNCILIWAACNGHLEIVKYLCEVWGVDPGTQNNEAIILALHFRHFEIVKYLCSKPSVDLTLNNNELIRIATFERTGMVEYLCEILVERRIKIDEDAFEWLKYRKDDGLMEYVLNSGVINK